MGDGGDWTQLGRDVARARLAAGYRDTAAWAEKVGRSTRVLLGLERGEPQGRRTLEAVELALDWPPGRAHRILFGTEPVGPLSEDDENSREPYLTRREGPPDLSQVSTDALLEEIAKRARGSNPDADR